jgi:hypothetical protein
MDLKKHINKSKLVGGNQTYNKKTCIDTLKESNIILDNKFNITPENYAIFNNIFLDKCKYDNNTYTNILSYSLLYLIIQYILQKITNPIPILNKLNINSFEDANNPQNKEKVQQLIDNIENIVLKLENIEDITLDKLFNISNNNISLCTDDKLTNRTNSIGDDNFTDIKFISYFVKNCNEIDISTKNISYQILFKLINNIIKKNRTLLTKIDVKSFKEADNNTDEAKLILSNIDEFFNNLEFIKTLDTLDTLNTLNTTQKITYTFLKNYIKPEIVNTISQYTLPQERLLLEGLEASEKRIKELKAAQAAQAAQGL